MSGAILSFDVVYAGSLAIITLQEANKQVEGKIRNFIIKLGIK